MAVPVVIDGYNVLYARGESPSAESRERLVRDLVRWAQRRGRQAILVFDAWAQGQRVEHVEARGPVTVCFTRYGERADAWIVRRVTARPEAVVVSSDREVARAARRQGSAVLGAEAFLARLDAALGPGVGGDAAPAPAPPGRRPGRQAAWLRGL